MTSIPETKKPLIDWNKIWKAMGVLYDRCSKITERICTLIGIVIFMIILARLYIPSHKEYLVPLYEDPRCIRSSPYPKLSIGSHSVATFDNINKEWNTDIPLDGFGPCRKTATGVESYH